MKNVKSSDPRKRGFMEALKQVSGATKVTNMKEDSQFVYGDCLKHVRLENGRRSYERLGTQKIPKA